MTDTHYAEARPAPRPASFFEEEAHTQETVDARWMMAALLRYWMLVAALAVLLGGLAAAYVVMRPENYTAVAIVKVSNLVLSNSQDNAFFAEAEFEPTFLETQILSITADPIVLAVLDELGPPLPAGAAGYETLRRFKQRLEAVRVGQSSLVAIRFTDEDPVRAADVANATVVAYGEQLRVDREEAAAAAGNWLRARLREVGPRVQSVARALPPVDKSDPRGILIVGGGVVAGGTLGAVAAILLALLDPRIRTSEAARRASGAPCLGAVPVLKGKRRRRRGGAARPEGGRFDPASLPPLLVEPGRDPLSAPTQLSRLLRPAAGGPGPHMVGITSLMAGEGKTVLAANLATAAAANGLRVLLLDAATHHPALTRSLVSEGEPSGSGFLRNSEPDGFDFMPLQPVPQGHAPDPGPTLDKARDTADEFDLVIADLPPLLADAELRSAVTRLDAVLLVIDWNRISARELTAALSLNPPVRERLAGVVLNRARFRRAEKVLTPEASFLARRHRFDKRRARA